MTYPAITRNNAQRVVNNLLDHMADGTDLVEGIEIEASCETLEFRPGSEYDRQAVDRCSNEARKKFLPATFGAVKPRLSQSDQSNLEASMAEPLHRVLSQLDVNILQDPDFWRYLAVFPFRWFLLAREPELQPQDFGGTRTIQRSDGKISYQGTDLKHQLLFRTYLWGKCAFDDSREDGGSVSPYERARAIRAEKTSVIDVWHSHMIRVQMGQLGEIPHAFIDVVAGEPGLSTDESRELEKLISRVKHNVLLDCYNYSEASEFVNSQVPIARSQAKAIADQKKEKAKKIAR